VAGTVSAVTNNFSGVAGVAGGSGSSPGVSLMSCQVFTNTSSGGFANAPVYAADNGAAISQNSWSYQYVNTYDQAVLNAIDYFNANGGGAVLDGGITIFAAGNDDSQGQWYPACYSGTFAVAATNNQDIRSYYSNYDTWVDVSAPGGETRVLAARGVYSTDISSGYQYMQGTSMACPHVSGIAGLVVSYAYRNGTILTNSEVANIIKTTTDDHYAVNPSYIGKLGTGRVNAYSALLAVPLGTPSCEITNPVDGSYHIIGGLLDVQVTASDPDGSIDRVEFYLDGAGTPSHTDYTAPYSWSWDTAGQSTGSHTILAKAYDNEDNSAEHQISITLLNPPDEGFETGNFSAWPWTFSGNASWTVQSAEKLTGSYAAKSGTITHSQTSSMSVQVDVASSGTISFYQKVSSQSGYDYLRFYIDDVQQGQWSGSGEWTPQSYAVSAGSRTFRWTYSKNSSVSEGSDCAWVDHIIFPPLGDPATITWNPSSFTQYLYPEDSDSQTLTIGNSGDETLNYTVTKPSESPTVLDENFEHSGSLPAGWTQVYLNGTTSWVAATGGVSGNPSAAYEGTYNALLSHNGLSVTRLITPSLNLAGAASASLSFWHAQAVWGNRQDQLRVYYRTSSEGSWNLLAAYTESVTTWTQRIIDLPNPSATYYLAFQGTTNNGYGVCVDKVVVTASGIDSAPWLTVNGGNSHSSSIPGGSADHSISIGFDATGLSPGTYTSNIYVNSNSSTNPEITIPVTLTVNAYDPLAVPFAEGFEAGLNDWLSVNGSQTNQWHQGTATANTGAASVYISTDAGATHGYDTSAASIVHLCRDISFPFSRAEFRLKFNWRGQGESGNDQLKVFLVDTSVMPAAGSEPGSGQIGSLYSLGSAWQQEDIDLGSSLAGTEKRLVFTWVNNSSGGTQPPAAVDDIRIVRGDNSDAAVVIDGDLVIAPPPVSDPESNLISPSISVTGLSGDPDFIIVTSDYALPEVPYENAGLCLGFSGADFSGTTITVEHGLGWVPTSLSYRQGASGNWNLLLNPGSWTSTMLSFSIPSSKAGEDLLLVLPNSEEGTLPVTLSSFNAMISTSNLVRLDWVTQSESGALGYYLHRAESEDLASAQMVSPLIPATNTSHEQHYSYTDAESLGGTTYYYWLQCLDLDGWTMFFGPVSITTAGEETTAPNIPLVTQLNEAYPNPFNPSTTLSYSLHAPSEIRLDIFNLKGQLVRSYSREHNSAGNYSISFDGRDLNGNLLASGIYFYRLTAGKFTQIRKLVLSK